MKNINCPNCQKIGQTHRGKYHYTESGLQNVWLDGVEIFECACGESFAFIPCAKELHKIIAGILLKRKAQLSGREIRFLRKYIGLKSKEFANRLGVKIVTVSRWEHGDVVPPESIDRLIRFFYAAAMNLGGVAPKIAKGIFRKRKKGEKEPSITLSAERINQACALNA